MLTECRAKRSGGWIASACLVAAAACAGTAAQAQITLPTDPGVMSFPNVRVELVTPSGQAATAAASSPRVKAYRDPLTGGLTSDPAQSEIDALDSLETARRLAASKRAQTVFSPVGGGIAVMLDDSSAMFAVARIGDDGVVQWACVEDYATALNFVGGSTSAATAGIHWFTGRAAE